MTRRSWPFTARARKSPNRRRQRRPVHRRWKERQRRLRRRQQPAGMRRRKPKLPRKREPRRNRQRKTPRKSVLDVVDQWGRRDGGPNFFFLLSGECVHDDLFSGSPCV